MDYILTLQMPPCACQFKAASFWHKARFAANICLNCLGRVVRKKTRNENLTLAGLFSAMESLTANNKDRMRRLSLGPFIQAKPLLLQAELLTAIPIQPPFARSSVEPFAITLKLLFSGRASPWSVSLHRILRHVFFLVGDLRRVHVLLLGNLPYGLIPLISLGGDG